VGDFLLDCREAKSRARAIDRAASQLKFCASTEVKILERDSFSLLLTRVDGFDLWGPYAAPSAGGEILVALAGRVALNPLEWATARKVEGEGGLACKAIFETYRKEGIDALARRLNGNYTVFIYDEPAEKLHIVTDRCGMFLCYGPANLNQDPVFCSHPDVLASVLGEEQKWDNGSLAEFLMTGRLTFPYTYHQNIKGLDTGAIHTVSLRKGGAAYESKRHYFQFEFNVHPDHSEEDLAEQLAAAFRNAVQRRTLPLFGTTGIGMSGGLDSRAIVSATAPRDHVRAFTLFDEENAEYRVARTLAAACGVEMIPIQRDFEHYANSAELGVRISGGTGCVSSNHFLGVRSHLAQLGIQNLVTGCHCDYMLKGLALNTAAHRFSRQERMAGFRFQFYRPCYWVKSLYSDEVEARLQTQFPETTQPRLSEADWLNVERKRTFPLAYEADLAQRVIPQRVLPWFPLLLDNEILETYLQIPSRYKLNLSLFSKMLLILCDKEVCRIPNINTGAAVGASGPTYLVRRYVSALQNRIVEKILPRMSIRGSWPNWEYYIRHSKVISAQWARHQPATRDIFIRLLGSDPYKKEPRDYRGGEVELFVRLWTQKLWMEQRN